MSKKLGSLGELVSGYQLRSATKFDSNGKYNLVQLGDVTEEGVADSLLRMNIDVDDAKFGVQVGDVLCRSRGGKYVASLVERLGHPTIATSSLFIFRANLSVVAPAFVTWWINLPATQFILAKSQTGSNIKSVSLSAFADLTVPAVPLSVQEKVVEIDRLNRAERKLELNLADRRANYIEQRLMDLVQATTKEK